MKPLIDWEAGIRAALSRWARSRRLGLDAEALLAACSGYEAAAEAGHPPDAGMLAHPFLRRWGRRGGRVCPQIFRPRCCA